MRGVLISLIVIGLGAGSALAQPAAELRGVEDAIRFVETHPRASMEDVLERISGDIRGNFALIFDSRSPVKASLEVPRVAMTTDDGAETFAFAGKSTMQNGNRLEMARFDRQANRLELSLIEFNSGKPAVITRNPPACGACHGLGAGTKDLRHIWSTYPDWPGVYGSHHNGILNQTGVGTSLFQTQEFERQGFQRFLALESQRGRYAYLGKSAPLDLDILAARNTALNNVWGELNNRRLAQRAAEAILRGGLNAMTDLNRVRSSAASANSRGKVIQGIYSHYEEKRDQLLRLIESLGSREDRRYIDSLREARIRQEAAAYIGSAPVSPDDLNSNFSRNPIRIVGLDAFQEIRPHDRRGMAALSLSDRRVQDTARVMDLFDGLRLESRDLSMTRELNRYATSAGLSVGEIEGNFFRLVTEFMSGADAAINPAGGCSIRSMLRFLVSDANRGSF